MTDTSKRAKIIKRWYYSLTVRRCDCEWYSLPLYKSGLTQKGHNPISINPPCCLKSGVFSKTEQRARRRLRTGRQWSGLALRRCSVVGRSRTWVCRLQPPIRGRPATRRRCRAYSSDTSTSEISHRPLETSSSPTDCPDQRTYTGHAITATTGATTTTTRVIKVKGAMPQLGRRRGAHLPLAAVEPVGG